MLRKLGVQHVGTAAIDAELGAVRFASVLDVSINGPMSFGPANSLRARGVAVVFATGHELQDRADPAQPASVSKAATGEGREADTARPCTMEINLCQPR
jgi:hypothetical protein